MASTTLTLLRTEVYSRLGDTAENVVSSGVVDRQINEALSLLVRESESVGRPILNSKATITAAKDVEEIDLDAWLKDAGGTPNFRGRLFVQRTDTTTPVPVFWPMQGSYRFKDVWDCCQWYGIRRDNLSIPASMAMYKRGDRTIGYHTPPTTEQTLTAYAHRENITC